MIYNLKQIDEGWGVFSVQKSTSVQDMSSITETTFPIKM